MSETAQRNEQTIVEVLNIDCLYAGVKLKEKGYTLRFLNMASRQNPGDGVITGAYHVMDDFVSNLFHSL